MTKFKDFKSGSSAKKEEPAEDKRSCPVARERPQSEPDQALSGGSRVIASPLAKNTAESQGVKLEQVKGTGPNDRIVKADVDEAAAKKKPQPVEVAGEYVSLDSDKQRKAHAELLSYSKQNIPHYYVTISVELDNLVSLR